MNSVTDGLSLSAGCDSFERGRSMLKTLKSPLTVSSAEEWYVEKVLVVLVETSLLTSLDVKYSGAHAVIHLKTRTAKRK